MIFVQNLPLFGSDHLLVLCGLSYFYQFFFFFNALVLCFYLEHVQRMTFCRCFLIFNQAGFCIDDGVVLWLKIKKSYYSYYYNQRIGIDR